MKLVLCFNLGRPPTPTKLGKLVGKNKLLNALLPSKLLRTVHGVPVEEGVLKEYVAYQKRKEALKNDTAVPVVETYGKVSLLKNGLRKLIFGSNSAKETSKVASGSESSFLSERLDSGQIKCSDISKIGTGMVCKESANLEPQNKVPFSSSAVSCSTKKLNMLEKDDSDESKPLSSSHIKNVRDLKINIFPRKAMWNAYNGFHDFKKFNPTRKKSTALSRESALVLHRHARVLIGQEMKILLAIPINEYDEDIILSEEKISKLEQLTISFARTVYTGRT
eukprot:NODE_527_length_6442_cov_0.831941.p4 type:complete len:279 gc:universal NODE_527_length_6442_cov_0.831941:1752-2588(+)